MAVKPLLKNEELIILARDGDKNAELEFFNWNERLVYHIVRKYSNISDLEELVSIGKIGLVKAYNTFDLSKGFQFATYASRLIVNEVLMFDRKNKKHKRNIMSMDSPLNSDEDGNELTLSDVLSAPEPKFKTEDFDHLKSVLEEYRKNASPNYIKLLDLIFYQNKTQEETAKILGISQSYTSRMHSKVLKQLKKISDQFLVIPPIIKKKEGIDMAKIKGLANQKQTLVYIFTNHPTLENKEIYEITGFNRSYIWNAKSDFKQGKLKTTEPKINPDVKKKIEKYIMIRDVDESKMDFAKRTSAGIKKLDEIVTELEKNEVIKPKGEDKMEKKLNASITPQPGINTYPTTPIKDDENIILKNEISIESNKEEVVSLIDSLAHLLSSMPKDAKIEFTTQLIVKK